MKILKNIMNKLNNMSKRESIMLSALFFVFSATMGIKAAEWIWGPTNYENTAENIGIYEENIMLKSSYKIVTEAKIRVTQFGNSFETTTGGSGSGTVIENDGKIWLLTCAHVVDFSQDSPRGKVEMVDVKYHMEYRGRKIPLELKFSDKKKDVALLSTERDFIGYEGTVIRDFGRSKYLRPGDMAYVVGFPHGMTRAMSRGIISSCAYEFDFMDGPTRVFLGNVSISPGNSGGALFVFKDGEPQYVGMSQIGFGLNGVFGFILMADIRQSFYENDYEYILD
jgi:serine protease Do